MTKRGRYKASAKWGGNDCSRALWVDDRYWIDRGNLRGPDGYPQPLTKHLEKPDPALFLELEEAERKQPPTEEIY